MADMDAETTELVIIAALTASQGVIGKDGTMPWHLPDDLKRFRQLTTGYPIIMGRKTWELALGKRSLPQRHTVVVSRSLPPQPPTPQGNKRTTFCVVSSIPEAIAQVQHAERAFIIGGASIYAQTLAIAHRLELTLVRQDVKGDAYFPRYQELVEQHFKLIEQTAYTDFWIETYERLPHTRQNS